MEPVREWFQVLQIGEWFGVIVVVSALVSTGVAAAFPEETAVVAGHTAYVRVTISSGAAGAPLPSPVDYGLSSQRGSYLFGMFESSRPLDERDGRMVFAWNDVHQDPRKSPSLIPTGDFARILDRYGVPWTVYEFTYLGTDPFGAPVTHHAYGTRVSDIHHAVPGRPLPPGIDGAYNWVLTYRLDRLFPDRFELTDAGVVQRAIPAPVAAPMDPALRAVTSIIDPGVQETPPQTNPPAKVVFGLARTPAALEAADPAEGRNTRLA